MQMIQRSSPLAALLTLPPKEKYRTCGAGVHGGCAPQPSDPNGVRLPGLVEGLNGGNDVVIPTAPFALELDLDTHRSS